MNDPRRLFDIYASDLTLHQSAIFGLGNWSHWQPCHLCARMSLLLDAASLASDLLRAQESDERIRAGVAF